MLRKVSMCKAIYNMQKHGRVKLSFIEEELAADMQDNLRHYIMHKVWMFSGCIQNISFHFTQLILFTTVGLFLTITISALPSYPIVCGAMMMQYIILGFNLYHKRNILCWEISAMFEFYRLCCGVTCSLVLRTRFDCNMTSTLKN